MQAATRTTGTMQASTRAPMALRAPALAARSPALARHMRVSPAAAALGAGRSRAAAGPMRHGELSAGVDTDRPQRAPQPPQAQPRRPWGTIAALAAAACLAAALGAPPATAKAAAAVLQSPVLVPMVPAGEWLMNRLLPGVGIPTVSTWIGVTILDKLAHKTSQVGAACLRAPVHVWVVCVWVCVRACVQQHTRGAWLCIVPSCHHAFAESYPVLLST